MNPIRYPTELLQEVFEWTARTQEGHQECFKTATRISHVCQRWRAVALQTPALWENIQTLANANPTQIIAFMNRMIPRLKAKAPLFHLLPFAKWFARLAAFDHKAKISTTRSPSCGPILAR
jgi:hypothetical protein